MSEDDLYEQLKAFEGRPAAEAALGKDPVNEPMIRHWCEATGHPVPPDGSAPAAMLQVWTMGGLSGNTDRSPAYARLIELLDAAGCTSVVATDCEQTFEQPLRPGDLITFDSVIESVSPRKTTKLGTGYFLTTRSEIRVEGKLAGTQRFRILKYAPAQHPRPAEPAPRRPRPVINRDNAGFWQGVEQHRLLIQRCTACDRLRFPWLPGCNACGSPDWDTVDAAGSGTVFSYVVMHHPAFPAFTASDDAAGAAGPYAVALVELAEGVRIISNVIGVPYDKVRIGMPLRLEFAQVEEDLTLPVFRPEEA